MRTSDIFAPITDWAKSHKERDTNTMIERYSGIERRRVAQIKEHPNMMTLGELEAMGNAFGFRPIIVKEVKD